MSEDERGELVPLNRKIMRQLAGAEFDEDSRAIGEWLDGGPEPAFSDIADRLLRLHATLARRRWYTPNDLVQRALEDLKTAMNTPRNSGDLKGAVAGLVELTRGIVRGPPRPPGGGKGPLAAQMALGKTDR